VRPVFGGPPHAAPKPPRLALQNLHCPTRNFHSPHGGFHSPGQATVHNETTPDTLYDDWQRSTPARRRANVVSIAHRLRLARSPDSSTRDTPQDAPPYSPAPGSIQYSADRIANRFLLAWGTSESALPTMYRYDDRGG
jgi:hypothetical protein